MSPVDPVGEQRDKTLVEPSDLRAVVRAAIAAQDRLDDDVTVWDDMAVAAVTAVAQWLDGQSWFTPSEILLEALNVG